MRWVPPACRAIKVNVDGSFIREIGQAAVGVIVQDSLGSPLLMAWRVLHWCRDAEEAEAVACLEGLRVASRWPDRMVLLELDCSTVIGKFQERCRDRSIISPVICDGLEAIKALSDVSFSRVSSVGDSHEGPLKNRGGGHPPLNLQKTQNAKPTSGPTQNIHTTRSTPR
jgi:ribonuclease HI